MACTRLRTPCLQEMTVGGPQGIGGIHEMRHLLLIEVQQSYEHPRHLFLRAILIFSGAYSWMGTL